LKPFLDFNPKSKIQNPKSKIQNRLDITHSHNYVKDFLYQTQRAGNLIQS
jgi:hypothetical protein